MRSMLFVPGDSRRKFDKAVTTAADMLILDLEDSVAAGRKVEARAITADMLAVPSRRAALFVRVNAFDTGETLADLAAVMPGRPDGVVLPKCGGGTDVAKLALYLDAFEAAHGIAAGQTKILAIVTETAEALFGLDSYKNSSSRLCGMMWGGEDLAASLGATENRSNGVWHSPYVMARNLCLAGAAAANVAAIDTVSTEIGNLERIAQEAREARRDGFAGKAVIHPNHVDTVNAAFTPTADELAWARRIIAAFAADPAAGVVKIDDRMIDKPHLRAAERIVAAAKQP
ncbi:MAG: CoA ester lyase [Ferrovibrio sp.]|uniref:HpcH/HpaI aldolase/citrate lyase family protein n=1 Tax=Ferrovibrio sp. TaxID=1917215 RepID=UPI0026384C2A|nr:CoA ester lyase [Ferrovibrio sp.]MCW0234719.1 CoA ester lyase [Ferrovibrio sp.]